MSTIAKNEINKSDTFKSNAAKRQSMANPTLKINNLNINNFGSSSKTASVKDGKNVFDTKSKDGSSSNNVSVNQVNSTSTTPKNNSNLFNLTMPTRNQPVNKEFNSSATNKNSSFYNTKGSAKVKDSVLDKSKDTIKDSSNKKDTKEMKSTIDKDKMSVNTTTVNDIADKEVDESILSNRKHKRQRTTLINNKPDILKNFAGSFVGNTSKMDSTPKLLKAPMSTTNKSINNPSTSNTSNKKKIIKLAEAESQKEDVIEESEPQKEDLVEESEPEQDKNSFDEDSADKDSEYAYKLKNKIELLNAYKNNFFKDFKVVGIKGVTLTSKIELKDKELKNQIVNYLDIINAEELSSIDSIVKRKIAMFYERSNVRLKLYIINFFIFYIL